MKDNKCELIMLGTGNALATRCYNTCFVIKTGETVLLVDAGGGNGILGQLEKANVVFNDLHDVFITHAHTDHILGAIWVIRMVIHGISDGSYTGSFRVYGHDKVLQVLMQICRMTLSPKDFAVLERAVRFCEMKDKESFCTGDIGLQCFDILSTKEKQYGFRALLPNGKSLVCLGDEPYNEANRNYAEGAEWLLCEAFCLYRERDIFKPYEKHHSTALEAGILAERLKIMNLVLYHTEDRSLDTRKESYTEEAALNFSGNIFVPDDLERIVL